MHLFAVEIVRGTKSHGNTGAQFVFVTLQPLEFRFAGAELRQIAPDQRGNRCVKFRGLHPGVPIGIVVQ